MSDYPLDSSVADHNIHLCHLVASLSHMLFEQLHVLCYVCSCHIRHTGLHRQSEITLKEKIRVTMDRIDGKVVFDLVGLGGSFVPPEEDEEDDTDKGSDLVTVSTDRGEDEKSTRRAV